MHPLLNSPSQGGWVSVSETFPFSPRCLVGSLVSVTGGDADPRRALANPSPVSFRNRSWQQRGGILSFTRLEKSGGAQGQRGWRRFFLRLSKWALAPPAADVQISQLGFGLGFLLGFVFSFLVAP